MRNVLTPSQMQPIIEAEIDVSKASMFWCKACDGYALCTMDMHTKETIPTFDLSNILEVLPTFIKWDGRLYDLHSDCKHSIGYSIDWENAVGEYIDSNELCLVDKLGDDMLAAAYQMLLWCIENKYIKTE